MNIFNNPLGALTISDDFSQTPLINEFSSPIFEISGFNLISLQPLIFNKNIFISILPYTTYSFLLHKLPFDLSLIKFFTILKKKKGGGI